MFTGLESPWHLLLLLVAIIFFFGAKRLPEIGRSLGQGMREFKQSVTGEQPDNIPTTPPALPVADGTAVTQSLPIDRDAV